MSTLLHWGREDRRSATAALALAVALGWALPGWAQLAPPTPSEVAAFAAIQGQGDSSWGTETGDRLWQFAQQALARREPQLAQAEQICDHHRIPLQDYQGNGLEYAPAEFDHTCRVVASHYVNEADQVEQMLKTAVAAADLATIARAWAKVAPALRPGGGSSSSMKTIAPVRQ